MKSSKASSAGELSRFLSQLSEEELHVLYCGGGTLSDWANSITGLRWQYGKRRILRLAVQAVLNGLPDEEPWADRVRQILRRYRGRRLRKELYERRAELSSRLSACSAAGPSSDREQTAQKLSRLDSLMWLVDE
jgi:hypothetical protein